ncbi:hypothetical protein BT69DRAFT_1216818, partial [Atractiella rhizophila]
SIPVYNIDCALNSGGSVDKMMDLRLLNKDHSERRAFTICEIGPVDPILGYDWLFQNNLSNDRKQGNIKLNCCPTNCGTKIKLDSIEAKEI